MVAAIQFLLFSQPHPLAVVTHTGYKVPYQLHCWPPAVLLELAAELAVELVATEDELDAPATCK